MSGEIVKNDQLFARISTFVFDVDGVFTDGTVGLSDAGIYTRNYHTRDGFAVRKALDSGYRVWIITGGRGASVTDRFQLLGVEEVWCVPHQKKEVVLQDLIYKYQVAKEELCYMGDDVPDVEAMKMCGLKTCPKDACRDILDIADWVSHEVGGDGSVRAVIECVMRTQGKW